VLPENSGMDLDVQLNAWFKQVEEMTKLNMADTLVITQAGAAVLKKELEKETREKHYDTSSNHKAGEPHLADSVMTSPRNTDGRMTGVSTVGFSGDKAYIARFLNDGTKKMPPTHFVDIARLNATPKVLLAEKAAYEALLRKKGKR